MLAKLRGRGATVLLVVEVAGQVAGGIEYAEELDPQYRHAGIDVYLSERFQGRGLGSRAVALLARFLFDVRGHHRLTIDPAADNRRAIRAYEKVGFRRVGVMRQYELRADGRSTTGCCWTCCARSSSTDAHPPRGRLSQGLRTAGTPVLVFLAL